MRPLRLALAALLVLPAGAAPAQHLLPAAASVPVGQGSSVNVPMAGAASGGTTVAMPGAAGADVGGAMRGLSLEAGAGKVLSLPGGAANIFVADPKVVEVRPASPTSLFVFGVGPGRTTLAAMNAAGGVVAQYQVSVHPSAYGVSDAASTIARIFPGSRIRLEAVGNTLVITGQVPDATASARVEQIARSYLRDEKSDPMHTGLIAIDNRLTLASSQQVGLRVRIVEMSRSLTRELGINWQAFGRAGATFASFATANGLVSSPSGALNAGVSDLNATLDVLSQDNLVRTLAEPTLVTTSGETASFLAGGEFPIPVSQQNNAITVDYKNYGVMLSFVPTVMSSGRINLHVRPEVSDFTNTNSVILGNTNSSTSGTTTSGASSSASAGIYVPALTVRRAETTVELGSGQSFAIAGLLQDNINHSVTALPFLGDVPVLGALFRSDSFQRSETELVIVVTPYIVRPVDDPATLRAPDQSYTPPNDLDRIVRLRQVGAHPALPPSHVVGAGGFLVE